MGLALGVAAAALPAPVSMSPLTASAAAAPASPTVRNRWTPVRGARWISVIVPLDPWSRSTFLLTRAKVSLIKQTARAVPSEDVSAQSSFAVSACPPRLS